MALLLAVSSWTSDRPANWIPGETDEAAGILTAAGWRVVTVTAGMPLNVAWEMLNRSHQTRATPLPPADPPPPTAAAPVAARPPAAAAP